MRFHRLDLNLLVALDILVAERSITRAAIRLNLSQSATSGVLARLREYFVDELLVQVGRNMVLTPLAVSLATPVRDVLLQIQTTIESRQAFDPASSERHFRVISSDYPSTVLLADMARRLHIVAPKVTMEIMAPQDGYLEQVDRGEVDLLIMPEKYLSVHQPSVKLFEDNYSCVVWASNTVVGNTLTLEQFMAMGHVVTIFGLQRPGTSFEEWVLKNAGLERRIEARTNTFSSMPQFVIGTARIATMHTRLARVCAHYFPLRLLPPPMEIPPLVECMQWHRFYEKDPAHMWFRQLLCEVAEQGATQFEGY
jgi:LysR family nod box-dependent transcriptional activator